MTALCLTPSVIGAILVRPRPRPTLFPYTTLFRSDPKTLCGHPRTGEWRCCDIKRLEACPKSHFSIGPESPQVVVLEAALWPDEFDPIVVEQVVDDSLLETSSVELWETQGERVEPLAEGLLHVKAVRPIRCEAVSAERCGFVGECATGIDTDSRDQDELCGIYVGQQGDVVVDLGQISCAVLVDSMRVGPGCRAHHKVVGPTADVGDVAGVVAVGEILRGSDIRADEAGVPD